MPQLEKISLPKGTQIPDHIAMILDGNRRWARARGLRPWEGHRAGYAAIRKIAKAARDLGVHTFTIWAFSTENWERSKEEVDKIMGLIRIGLRDFRNDADRDKVRFIHLGRKDRLPKDIIETIKSFEEDTRQHSKYVLNLALDYGGRDEIVRATKKIIEAKVPAEKVDEKLFASYLDTADQPYPYPDLFIRTSGEQRTSGFLPWQMVYAEYYWEEGHLPDFTPEKLREAILDFSRRRRRFGGNDAVEHLDFDPEVVAKLELAWWRLSKIPAGTRLRDFAVQHLKEQFGLSRKLAKEAARYMLEAALEESNGKNWEMAKGKLKKFYKVIKDELKLAFEPSIVASLEVKLKKGLEGRENIREAEELEETARSLYAETYRISIFQAAKLAHLRIMAGIEKNLAEAGMGEEHWVKAQDYLERFYRALKERVA